MKDKINIELAKFQDELRSLDNAVKQIDKAGTISQEVIDAVKGIHNKYSEHLNLLVDTYKQQLDTTFQSFETKSNEVDQMLDTQKAKVDDVEKILEGYLELAQATTKLKDSILDMSLPESLEALNKKSDETLQQFQDTQMLLMTTEDTLKQENASLLSELKSIKKGQAWTKFLVIITMLIAAGSIALPYLKFLK